MLRIVMLGIAYLAFGLGCVGVFVPVLPTTPLLLLATFLFAKFSPRMHEWIMGTKIYKSYVVPFKSAGGVPVGTKIRIITVSYIVLIISAIAAQKVHVWIILACVAIFLAWLMAFRIPTVHPETVRAARNDISGESEEVIAVDEFEPLVALDESGITAAEKSV